jgi:sugar phosphate isomerase/epimerase
MALTRRNFMKGTLAAGACAGAFSRSLFAEEKMKIRVGICDWSFGGTNPAALDAAKGIGLEGVQISPPKDEETLAYAKPEVQEAYKKKSAETGLAIASLAITLGNSFPIATDPRAPGWLEQTVDATQVMGARAILMAFFGKGDLLKDEKDLNEELVAALVERLKKVAPRAKEKGVVLGLENWLSAEQNEKIMDAVGSDAVGVYYDIANSAKKGYDVPAEIRRLGKRICQFHFKDGKGLLENNPQVEAIVAAVKEIRYEGWIILEQHHGKDAAAYYKQNAEFVRKAFGLN